ncbi:MAG TPA: histidine triad nucleotide-binding protein [Chthoniobacteraceae bacterium]|jgi:histidine triad (HIT) family protein|nr:histidine triad nucleotide-binding protein [Chthoniobacteraceae bacterium]
MTLFEKIARREIPADILYEEEDFMVLRDINPQAPVHVLMIPKKPIPRVGEASPEDAAILGKMLAKSGQIARQLGIYDSGYRLVINHGPDAGETVPHLHIHLLGKRTLAWPPG